MTWTTLRHWMFDSASSADEWGAVSTWGTGAAVTVVYDQTANQGMHVTTNLGIGHASTTVELPAEAASSEWFRFDFCCKSSAAGYGYTDNGMSLHDRDGNCIVKIVGHDDAMYQSEHKSFYGFHPVSWVRCVIEYNAVTGDVKHILYNDYNTEIARNEVTLPSVVGKIPYELRAGSRHYKGANGPHDVIYNNIILSYGSPTTSPTADLYIANVDVIESDTGNYVAVTVRNRGGEVGSRDIDIDTTLSDGTSLPVRRVSTGAVPRYLNDTDGEAIVKIPIGSYTPGDYSMCFTIV